MASIKYHFLTFASNIENTLQYCDTFINTRMKRIEFKFFFFAFCGWLATKNNAFYIVDEFLVQMPLLLKLATKTQVWQNFITCLCQCTRKVYELKTERERVTESRQKVRIEREQAKKAAHQPLFRTHCLKPSKLIETEYIYVEAK